MLAVNSEVAFTPGGNSMLPLLRNQKDKIVLRKPEGKLRKYDVPLYKRSNGAFVLHRVVGIKSDGYVMCGDNQTIKEYSVKDDCIIAVMSSFYRDGKHIYCDSFLYKLYSRIWVLSMPVRKLYRRTRSLLGRIRRKLFGK
ncbi:MAG: hypothetical protein E7588_00590 [Ruminococcaceae bacterium]|nr:hypothetical protein [Oscillospiraceae bacterium]